jgi:formamidopyrimidine-DNA glycosylase
METGAAVTYNDPRRFGYMLLVPETELAAHPLMKGLGVEPLGPGLTASYLAERARGKAVDLKAFLSDQRIVAGLGNIYVCEALHRARLLPTRKAATLAVGGARAKVRAMALEAAVRSVLEDAIEAGGSSLRDYRRADGERGAVQERFAVYGREGEACPRPGCGGRIRRIVQAGRSTYFCPRCQR